MGDGNTLLGIVTGWLNEFTLLNPHRGRNLEKQSSKTKYVTTYLFENSKIVKSIETPLFVNCCKLIIISICNSEKSKGARKMNILFSPIGTTDPVSEYNLRDGAMLHICRYRQIDMVYMYMSNEICGYHDCDDRYVYCLNALSKHLERSIGYELIERRELTDNVNSFDYFINEFGALVDAIHMNHLEDTIYLNVSSGTPAMKSALQSLEAFVNYKVIPIQVTTPSKRSNGHSVDKKRYDPHTIWELNEDNIVNEDRTTISDNSLFFAQIKKRNIIQLIDCYDYVGAVALADSMKEMLSDEFLELIHAADERYKLNFRKSKAVFSKYGHKILEVETTGLTEIAEYLLILDLKVKREEYADFLRAITPLIADLFEMILRHSCGFKVDDYSSVSNNVRKWDLNKLRNNTTVISALNNNYGGYFRSEPIYSSAMQIIIETLSTDSKLTSICNELRSSEEKLRNIAAHEITGISEKTISANLGFTAGDIVKKLFITLKYAGISTKKNFFDSYDKMNRILVSKI